MFPFSCQLLIDQHHHLFCSVYLSLHFQDLWTGKKIGWGVRLDMASKSVFLSTFCWPFSSGFHFNGIRGWATLASLSSIKLFLGFLLSLLSVSQCHLGKHFCASYPRLDSLPSKNLFDLVHYDVQAPSYLTSMLGFKYQIFADDLFHASWVYPLKDHTHLSPSIRQFFQEIPSHYFQNTQNFSNLKYS